MDLSRGFANYNESRELWQGDGSQSGLTSCAYRIYLLGISCISQPNKIFLFENNQVLTGKDRRSAVRDPSPCQSSLEKLKELHWNLAMIRFSFSRESFDCVQEILDVKDGSGAKVGAQTICSTL